MEQQRLVIQIRNAEFEVALYDNPSTEKLVSALPMPIPANGKKTDLIAEGEVALWPAGN